MKNTPLPLTESLTLPHTVSDRESNINYQYKNIKNNFLFSCYTSSAEKFHERVGASPQHVSSKPPLGKDQNTDDEIIIVGVTLLLPDSRRKNRHTINISVMYNSGKKVQLSSKMVPWDRKRELRSNVADQYRDWSGYECALEHMAQVHTENNAWIGKMTNTATYQRGVPKSMPIVPHTASVMWIEDGEPDQAHVMLWMGDSEYYVKLSGDDLTRTQRQFYSATGYWKQAPMMDQEIF